MFVICVSEVCSCAVCWFHVVALAGLGLPAFVFGPSYAEHFFQAGGCNFSPIFLIIQELAPQWTSVLSYCCPSFLFW